MTRATFPKISNGLFSRLEIYHATKRTLLFTLTESRANAKWSNDTPHDREAASDRVQGELRALAMAAAVGYEK